jgi:hypothetical protein
MVQSIAQWIEINLAWNDLESEKTSEILYAIEDGAELQFMLSRSLPSSPLFSHASAFICV